MAHKIVCFIAAFLLGWLLAFPVSSQRYPFVRYSLVEGLPQSEVMAMCQDGRGYLWLGTAGGLSRFDGQEFVTYHEENGLPDNMVNAVVPDLKGDLWLGTGGGLVHFNGKTFTSALPDYHGEVRVLGRDVAGFLWLALWRGQGYDEPLLGRWKGGRLALAKEADGWTGGQATAMRQDVFGRVWIGTATGGLFFYQEGVYHAVELDGLLRKPINQIYFDSKGLGWLCAEEGVYKGWFGPGMEPAAYHHELLGGRTLCMMEDSFGHRWFGTVSGVVREQEAGQFERIRRGEGLSNYRTLAMLTDREGIAWISMAGDGLYKFSGEQFTYLTEREGMRDRVVSGIAGGPEGDVWALTFSGGVHRWNGEGFTYYNKANGRLPSNQWTSMAKGAGGQLWLGAFDGHVSCWTGREMVVFPKIDSIGAIMALAPLGGDSVLVGHTEGVVLLHQGKELLRLGQQYVQGNLNVRSLLPYKAGVLIGTRTGGVYYWRFRTRPGEFPEQLGQGAQRTLAVYDLAVRPGDSSIWLATVGDGLYTLGANDELLPVTVPGASIADVLYSLKWANDSLLYLGTSAGLTCIAANPNTGALQRLKHFGRHEGFLGVEANRGAIAQLGDSAVWVGTIDGIMIYHPNAAQGTWANPRLHITQLDLLYDRDALYEADSTYGWFHLPYRPVYPYTNSHITIGYTGISLKAPEQVLYRHRLLPHYNEWSPATRQNAVSYSNLGPGTYVFEVQAQGRSGRWGRVPARYHFSIQRPYWQTWWFFITVFCLFATGVALYIRNRTRKLRREKQVLEKEVALTHIIEEKNQALEEALGLLNEKNRDLMDSIAYARHIQDAILPLPEELNAVFPKHALLYKPRDVVSGDFYWIAECNGRKILAVVDCTGHGVPGAFMSLLGYSQLVQVVEEYGIVEPARILAELNRRIRRILRQEGQHNADDRHSMDGMDMGLLSYDLEHQVLHFAGAKRSLYWAAGHAIQELKGSRLSIGGNFQPRQNEYFASHQVPVAPGTTFYLGTDGLADQFGHEGRGKLKPKGLKRLLLSASGMPLESQAPFMEKELKRWMGDTAQTDDILFVALQFL